MQQLCVTQLDNIQTIRNGKGHSAVIRSRKWYGLTFSIDGQITYTHQGKRYVSTPGCAILLPKGETYQLHTDKGGLFPLINFQCEGYPEGNMIVIPLDNPESFLLEYEQMRKLFPFPHHRLRLLGMFYSMLSRLFSQSNRASAPLGDTLAYLEEHISDPQLSNTHLAQRLGVSEVYFRKRFLQAFGASPKQYILQLRLKHARLLLSEGAKSVSDIAAACGFSSVYHFSRCFKTHTGLSPTEYASQNKAEY